jgi:sec-independent protein translocase protein TatC
MSSESVSPFKSWALGFWGHVDELVRRFKVVLVAVILATIVGWLPTSIAGITDPIGGYQPILSLVMLKVKADFLPSQATLIAGGLGDTVFIMAYLSVIIALVLASPVIFYEAVAFIKPALYDNEKRVLGVYMGSLIGLLALGFAMAYFLIIPISFRILIYFTMQGGSVPFVFLKDFYSWIFTLFVLCGVFYTIPVFLVMLVHVGVLPIKFLKGKNKLIAYIAILMVFWIFGPDPTPVTGLIMLVPFIFVFETATYFARKIDRNRKIRKQAQANGTSLVQPSFWKSACPHCNSPIAPGAVFCPSCNRSIK